MTMGKNEARKKVLSLIKRLLFVLSKLSSQKEHTHLQRTSNIINANVCFHLFFLNYQLLQSLMQEYEWLNQLKCVPEFGNPPSTHCFWPMYGK